MRNTFKVFGAQSRTLCAIVIAVLAFSMAACGGGGAQTTYRGTAGDGKAVEITLTESASRQSSPQSGDIYVIKYDGYKISEGEYTLDIQTIYFYPLSPHVVFTGTLNGTAISIAAIPGTDVKDIRAAKITGVGLGDRIEATATAGRLTITGLGAYEGGGVSASKHDPSTYLHAASRLWYYSENYFPIHTLENVSGGQVTLKVWEEPRGPSGQYGVTFTGPPVSFNRTITLRLYVNINPPSFSHYNTGRVPSCGYVDVSFVNGVGSGAFVSTLK